MKILRGLVQPLGLSFGLFLGIASSAHSFANEIMPEISAFKVNEAASCGNTSCTNIISLSFIASTTGLCENFSVKFKPLYDDKGDSIIGNLVTIIKTRDDHCGRAEHEVRYEPQSIIIDDDNLSGPYYLANPLAVNAQSK